MIARKSDSLFAHVFERLIRFNPAETFFCDSICDIDQSKPARKKGERHEPAEHRLRTPLRRAA